MSDPKAENDVKKLARLNGNTICPNCGSQKKFGFSTVCIKFLTFVCNECKASHAAYSHRCKSLTMSSWTAGEVLQLKKAGNNAARATWLAKAPPCGSGGRPQPGDDINKYKQFIVDVYERKKYYSETPVAEPETPPDAIVGSRPQRKQSSNNATRTSVRALPQVSSRSSAPPPVRKPVVAAAPAPPKPVVAAPIADLLSFSGEPETTTIAATPAATSSAPVFDPFNTGAAPAPVTSSITTPAPSAVVANNAPFDPFGNANAAAPASAMASPVSTTTTVAGSSGSFDPFGNNSSTNGSTATSEFGGGLMTATTPTQPVAEQKKTPIMNHDSASKVSAMGFHMTNNTNGMANNTNQGGMANFANSTNMMMMQQQQQQQQMMMMNGMQNGVNNNSMPMNPSGMQMMNNTHVMGNNNAGATTMQGVGMNNNTMMGTSGMQGGGGGMMMMNNNMASMSLNISTNNQVNGDTGMNGSNIQTVMNFGGSQTGNTISQMSSKSASEPQKPDPFASLF